MRNPVSEQSRPLARVLRGGAALVAVQALMAFLLVIGAGTASAAQAEPNAMTFGLLGPVGLVAVVLGVLGMAAGVVRQRRKARAQVVAMAEPAADVPAYSRSGE
ncbi:hypothetical protein FHU38_004438 [Saccharomonospora amisosensis]|uniref:Uncharacterized protein n=1 Tax=Saccharomonospora amisosensis TaxID=1128677 RepID=A0A7X5ZSL4_9PSEU|nr:hypothetical protein [Saccharomonospora amisosensis]NIJ14094.1 hypothetical protein [Saccharomonospora amisosensis]